MEEYTECYNKKKGYKEYYKEYNQCPHCGKKVKYGYTVCVGCQAEITYTEKVFISKSMKKIMAEILIGITLFIISIILLIIFYDHPSQFLHGLIGFSLLILFVYVIVSFIRYSFKKDSAARLVLATFHRDYRY